MFNLSETIVSLQSLPKSMMIIFLLCLISISICRKQFELCETQTAECENNFPFVRGICLEFIEGAQHPYSCKSGICDYGRCLCCPSCIDNGCRIHGEGYYCANYTVAMENGDCIKSDLCIGPDDNCFCCPPHPLPPTECPPTTVECFNKFPHGGGFCHQGEFNPPNDCTGDPKGICHSEECICCPNCIDRGCEKLGNGYQCANYTVAKENGYCQQSNLCQYQGPLSVIIPEYQCFCCPPRPPQHTECRCPPHRKCAIHGGKDARCFKPGNEPKGAKRVMRGKRPVPCKGRRCLCYNGFPVYP